MSTQNFPSKSGPKFKNKLPVLQHVPNQTLKGSLKKLKFNPVTFLINDVYPQLDSNSKARILMQLIGYLYEKPVLKPKPQKAVKNTINISTSQPNNGKEVMPTNLQDLIRIASAGNSSSGTDSQ